MFFYRENISQLVEAWLQSQVLSGTLAVESGDQFGYSIAINSSGDRVVVCAKSDEKTGTTGHGIAYVFVSGAGGWIEQQILSGSLATNSGDDFGFSVAMNSSGDRVVIGAMNDERISGSSSEGLAYIFVSGSDGWLEQQILSGSLATNISDSLGRSVAINSIGDIVVVGAHLDEKIQSGEGVVYIFVSGTNGWVQQQILSGSRTNAGDRFGTSVAINLNGDYIVVGAERDDGGGSASSAGAAYIFVSGTNGWTEQQILSGTLAETSDTFGRDVKMNSNGNIIVVTAPNDERTGQSSLLNEGLVYIFVSGASGWIQQQILSGSLATGSFDNFGYSIAINSTGDLIIVGAPADEAIGAAASSGLVYVFVSGAGGWSEQYILSGSLATGSTDVFGFSVATNSDGNLLIAGAYNDESVDEINGSGLAYIFHKKLV